MNAVTMFIILAFVAFLMYYAVMLVVRVRRNYLAGSGFRESLLLQVTSIRIGKMMDALGINKVLYLHQETVIDINNHISHCAECNNTAVCDEKLDSQSVSSESIDFCNNEESLVEISRKQNATSESDRD